MNGKTIYCDECNKEFKLVPRTRRVENDVQGTYIKCDHCNKEYFCYATNDESRKVQKKIKKESNFVKKQDLIKQHKVIVSELNNKYR